MSLSLLLIAASAATTPATHVVQLNHAGSTIDAVYTARADVETKTIGAHTPNRADNRRCMWTATVVVERQLGGKAEAARVISNDHEMTGSRSGPCSEGKQRSIEQEIAGRQDGIKSHLASVAAKDHAPLMAELSTVRPAVLD